MSATWQRQLILSTAIASIAAGCIHNDNARPLAPAVLGTAPRTEKQMSTDPLSGSDQPGMLSPYLRETRRRPLPSEQPIEGLSSVVQENVKPPGPGEDFPRHATTRSTTGPTTGPTTVGVSSGQYYEIGGVVMNVNGTPIYANKVVSLLDPVFAAKARDLDVEQFRAFASREITRTIAELCNDQLEYAAADRYLDQKDKDLAEYLTKNWRDQLVTAAGGSAEVARNRAEARGENIDDLAHQQYRTWMSRIYYEKKIMPRIQISATDILDYYDRHRDQFTERGTARFRLIKIEKAKHRGVGEAEGLANSLHNRIVNAGESFEAVARSVNDDPRWLASGGDLGAPIEEHAFAITPVDQAVWSTPVGQVTPVIDGGNALYIAKVEERKLTIIHKFDEEAVQAQIEHELRAQQFREARTKVLDALRRDAAVVSTPSMQNAALEMAMQNYPKWAGK